MTDWRALCQQLAAYDTPTICNVIELFGVRPLLSGFTGRTIRAAYPSLPPMVGFASTAICRVDIPRADGQPAIQLTDHLRRFAELSGPPVIVLQDLSPSSPAASFGELMCTAYRAFGARGLVTNGAGRDLEQIAALRFPLFMDGAIASHGHFHFIDLHTEVQIGGIPVRPDDLIHADLNGVVVFPRDLAESIPAAAAEFIAAEQLILRALRQPSVTLDTFEDALASAGQRFEALRQRLH